MSARDVRMTPRWLPRWRVESRMALGLATLFVGLLLMLDLLLGVAQDRERHEWELRRAFAEGLAISVAQLMQAQGGVPPLDAVQQMAGREPRARAVALHDQAGRIAPLYGAADTVWANDGQRNSLAEMRVPILLNGQPYGDLHVAFAPWQGGGVLGWLGQPFGLAVLGLGLGGWLAAYLYLRRVLHQIDPQQAIPQRVRAAFDVLDEGVLMLDTQHRVMLCNDTFTRLLPKGSEPRLGQPVTQFAALQAALEQARAEPPWQQALRLQKPSSEVALQLPGAEGVVHALIVKATPVLDARGRTRGSMVSFDDITALQLANHELAASRDELRLRNQELTRLATRDPMTNCLNRRSFFELAEPQFGHARRTDQALCCVMVDIDHFKRINDTHGHQVGDAVIMSVSQALGHALRDGDLLCRYGGEEFCLLLPGLDLGAAQAVAERLRQHIEEHAGPQAGRTSGAALGTVTASFGVAEIGDDQAALSQLIEHADMALYVGKRDGRNRVSAWRAAPQPVAPG